MIGPSGPAVAHASLSPRQASERGLLTSGTFGPPGIGSSHSVSLTASLASRLQARMASLGSILFRLTWKTRVTPSGRRICQQRASVLRISASDSGSSRSGWRSPDANTRGGDYADPAKALARIRSGHQVNLADQVVAYAAWQTPTAIDATGRPYQYDQGDRTRPRLSNAGQICGAPLIGYPAPTESTGQLNPAFSCWLQGYPHAVLNCAPSETPSSRRSQPSSSKRPRKR